jgi:hypothetical protein
MAIVDQASYAVFVLGMTVALTPVQAHHSYAAFDRCKAVTLEGEIRGVEWVNPHIRIHLRTTDVGDYFVEWFSLLQLQQAGITPDTLRPGDHVVVSGNAMRDPSMKVLSLLTEIRRPSDDWRWVLGRERPATCTPPAATD